MTILEEADNGLVERAVKGDREAFHKLVIKYQGKVFGACLYALGDRVEAEDAAQEVFLQVYRALADYRGESSFATWLHRVTLNKCLDIKRKRSRRSQLVTMVPLEEDLPKKSEEFTPEEVFIHKEMSAEIHQLVESLPDKYRDVINLYHFQQLSHQEIAIRLEIEVKSVATRLYRAKMMMQERIRKEGNAHDRSTRRESTYHVSSG